jgi:hypothetical protein
MMKMLSIEKGMRVLEPCAGDGVFVDALSIDELNLSVDIYELNEDAVVVLNRKYGGNKNVRIIHGDTLASSELDFYSETGGVYDRIIANPPYGGWLDYSKRKVLRRLYPGLYVKETYTLFLFRCIQLLRENGILVFIIPDTFLNLHMHTKLREYLWMKTKIKEIVLFSSSFFPGISFGYSNLCIMTLQKSSNVDYLDNKFRVITGFKRVEELLQAGNCEHHKVYEFSQRDIYCNVDHALFTSENPKIMQLINFSRKRVGDIADCVTGFYSGNDEKYLRAMSSIRARPRNRAGSRYKIVDEKLVFEGYKEKNILDGIEGPKCFIPIVKGGATKYLKPDTWYMEWSVEAVRNYKTDEKARFQNSKYYFKFGISVPMVSSTQITAALIENRLFDQSIVGIFPRESIWVCYLLAFFNSPTCNRLIRAINPSTNNSANYIKKIPFIPPSEQVLTEIDKTTMKIVEDIKKLGKYDTEDEKRLHGYFREIYGC